MNKKNRIALAIALAICFANTSGCSLDSVFSSTEKAAISGEETSLVEIEVIPESRVYFDIKSDSNLLFSKYDLELELDGKALSTLSNGDNYCNELSIQNGSHTLTIHKSDSNTLKDSCDLDITGDMVLTTRVKHENNSVEFYNMEITEGMDRIEGAVPDVIHLSLGEALDTLKSAGFSNVNAFDTNGNKTYRKAYFVQLQSVDAGTILKKTDEIRLDCIDIDLYFNSLLSGKTFAEAEDLIYSEGFQYRCESDSGVVLATPECDKDDWIVEKSCHDPLGGYSAVLTLRYVGTPVEQNTIEIEGPIPNVTGMVLDKALELLQSEEFSNCSGTYNGNVIVASEKNQYLVTSQSVPAGVTCRKSDEVQLDCIDFDEYCSTLFTGKTFSEVKTIAESEGIGYGCRSVSGSVIQEPTADLSCWIVEKVTHNSMTEKSVLLRLRYDETLKESKTEEAPQVVIQDSIEQLPDIVMDTEQSELLTVLTAALPLEAAREAVRIAFTNCEAMDVFTSDGMNFDQTKFHDSSYTGEFAYIVSENGVWSADSTWAWKVEDMLLVKSAYDRAIRLSCKVTCDGQNYIIYNVSYVAARTQYVDSGDPSKTSGTITMEPSDYNPYLTIPTYMVAVAASEDSDSFISLSETPDYIPTLLTYNDYEASINRDWWHSYDKDYPENVIGTGEGMTLSISTDSREFKPTKDDFLIFDPDECFSVEYIGTRDYANTYTVSFRIYCTKVGNHYIGVCSVYDYTLEQENDAIYSIFDCRQLDDYDGQLVYTTPTGKRRHLSADCAGENATPTTRYDARIWGLDACGNCGG